MVLVAGPRIETLLSLLDGAGTGMILAWLRGLLRARFVDDLRRLNESSSRSPRCQWCASAEEPRLAASGGAVSNPRRRAPAGRPPTPSAVSALPGSQHSKSRSRSQFPSLL